MDGKKIFHPVKIRIAGDDHELGSNPHQEKEKGEGKWKKLMTYTNRKREREREEGNEKKIDDICHLITVNHKRSKILSTSWFQKNDIRV